MEEEKTKVEAGSNALVVSYDIKKDVKDCPVTATVGQLIKDNPLYRKQLKEMLAGKRRRKLPKVGTVADVRMLYEDHGSPEIDIQISGCALSYVVVDGGSAVNIMIEATAHQLGFTQLQPTTRTMRLANGARVVPVGSLTDVPTIIGGKEFLLNYLVLRPDRPSTYPVLIGRPWLYGAKVTTDWDKKEFRFGRKPTVVSWDKVQHLGETTQISEEYDSDMSNESEVDDAYMVDSWSNLEEGHQLVKEGLQPSSKTCDPSTCDTEGAGPSDTNLEVEHQHKEASDTTSKEAGTKGHIDAKDEGPVYGGLRLATLEESLDSSVRNKMDAIRSEQYRKISIKDGKDFNLGYALKPPEEKCIQELLAEYLDVFPWDHKDITGVNPELGELSIDLMLGAKAIRQRQHRRNPKYSMMVKEEIERLLDASYIYPMLNSEWVSPLVVVPKKPSPDGKPKIRICQDFRKLNDATKKDYYPIPFTDMILDIVAGWELYSFLDGYSGYNQIWIRKEDQLKTAFTTEWGVFAFRRMPFGLCNAPGMFQRLMMNIFHDFLRKFLEVFIDDFAVYGRATDHIDCLRQTFQRCREVGLKLHPGKCYFAVSEGILLGHKVSKRGIEVDWDKVTVWLAISFPTNATEVKGFLGCVGYYRRFIEHFAKLALPLTSMLKAGADFQPTPARV